MKVLVVGGGSGGHITPAVAVIRGLLEMRPRAIIEFWTDKKYYRNVVKITTEIGMHYGREEKMGSRSRQYIRVRRIAAGKFHRYAGWQLKDYFENFTITMKDLVWGNICGFCGFTAGLVQAFLRLVRKESRPDVIFLKGGFVGLPVGMVARMLKIPYVIHESDAVPGLANRLLMKHATIVAFGLEQGFSSPGSSRPSLRGSDPMASLRSRVPRGERQQAPQCDEKTYSSPNATKSHISTTTDERVVYTGTPVAPEFKKVSATKQKSLKRAMGFSPERPLVVVTGGSQGSQHINEAMREILPEMLKFTSVGLVAGRSHYEDMVDLKKYEEWDKAKLQSNFRLWNFNSTMNELMGAADVVVSRAGATTIAELAALGKAIVLVPFERLPGGHQVKNAEKLASEEAALVVMDEKMYEQPGVLLEAVRTLVRSPKKRELLAKNLHATAKEDAAKELAEIIVKQAEK